MKVNNKSLLLAYFDEIKFPNLIAVKVKKKFLNKIATMITWCR